MKIKKINEFGPRGFGGGMGFGGVDGRPPLPFRKHGSTSIGRAHKMGFDYDDLIDKLDYVSKNIDRVDEDRQSRSDFDIAQDKDSKFICGIEGRGSLFIMFSSKGGLTKPEFYKNCNSDSPKGDFDYFIEVDLYDGMADISGNGYSFGIFLMHDRELDDYIRDILDSMREGRNRTKDSNRKFKDDNKGMEDQEDTKTWDSYQHIKKFGSI